MLTKAEHWREIQKGPGGTVRRKQFAADRDALVAQGRTGDEAFAILAGPGGKYEILAPSPAPSMSTPAESSGQPASAGLTPAFSPAKDFEDREAERRRQAGFKRKLCSKAGKKDSDHKAMVEWAAKWQPQINYDGLIHWEDVNDVPPCAAAVGLLEHACTEPAKFYEQTMAKSLGKGAELGDDLLVRERKREAELLRLLDELDAEDDDAHP